MNLKKKGMFAHHTYRKNRRHFPTSIVQLGLQLIPNMASQLLDGNPVHLLSSVDGSSLTTVKRRFGAEKHVVKAPNDAVKEYNRFDQLMQLFVLHFQNVTVSRSTTRLLCVLYLILD